MTCLRCKTGFVVPETFTDGLGSGEAGYHIHGWRCVMCGCRGEGSFWYGSTVGTLSDGAAKRYGAVHQYKDRGYDDE